MAGMKTKLTVGIAGCGTIGRKMASEIDGGGVPGARLGGITSRRLDRAREFASTLCHPTPVVALSELVESVDMVIEAAPANAMEAIATETLSAGKDLMALSCGALLEREDLFDLAERSGATIHVPSGAIAGLDGAAGAAVGGVESVTMITRKPPDGLRGAPGAQGIYLDGITELTVLYEGPALEACRLFPANVNVSAALSMAGIGPRRTQIRICADPTITRNTHEIEIRGEFGALNIRIENIPSESNPKTGLMSALSALAMLKKMTSRIRIGT